LRIWLQRYVSSVSGCDHPLTTHQLGEIRNTFYGPLWNVRSLGSASRNIAYTNVDLGLHMDLCYFQNPPRFQFLHSLRNRVRGGSSIFVDSFKVAEHMWEHHREAWHLLAKVSRPLRHTSRALTSAPGPGRLPLPK